MNHENFGKFASELFNFWDHEKKGSIKVMKLVEDFILMGIAPNTISVIKVLAALKEVDFKEV